MIESIIGWFARVTSFDLNESTQVTQRVSSAIILEVDELDTESSTVSIAMPRQMPFDLKRDLPSNKDKQRSILTHVARSIATLKEELPHGIVKPKLAALSEMLRPGSKPTPSFAPSIARQVAFKLWQRLVQPHFVQMMISVLVQVFWRLASLPSSVW